MKVDLKLFPMFVQEQSDGDLNYRRDVCGRMLQEFHTVVKRQKVIFGDECPYTGVLDREYCVLVLPLLGRSGTSSSTCHGMRSNELRAPVWTIFL